MTRNRLLDCFFFLIKFIAPWGLSTVRVTSGYMVRRTEVIIWVFCFLFIGSFSNFVLESICPID